MSKDELQQQQIEFITKSLSDLNSKVDKGFEKVNAKLEILQENYVKNEQMKESLAYRDAEISSLKDNQKWLVRTVVGVIISAIISAILIIK